MKIKVYVVIASLWLMVLSVQVMSKNQPMMYEIQFDSKTENSAEIKNEVLSRYAKLIRGVHEESEAVLLKDNLNEFMWKSNMDASLNGNTLRIIIGNGTGVLITGDLSPQEICLPEVKTKSLIQELLG